MIELTEDIVDRGSPVPLYHQIAKHFQALIESGVLKPGDKLPTEAELIRVLKVSPITIRQALGGLVQSGMIYRERGRGTFVRPGAQLNSSRAASHGRVALVMPWASGTLFAPLVEAVEHTLHQARLHTLLVNNGDDARVEIGKLREALDHGLDGMLWVIPTKGPNAALFKQILDSDLPVVLIDRKAGDESVDFVGSDNRQGMRQIVQHVIETGRRHIAMVCEPLKNSATAERQQGYEQALREAGIAVDPSLIFSSRAVFFENGRRCARRILAHDRPIDAICCMAESSAIGALTELRTAGVTVPDQMALTAFDDGELAVASVPPLTTVRQDIYGMGVAAAELLLKRIEQPDRPPESRHLPTTLIIRESTIGNRQYVCSENPCESTIEADQASLSAAQAPDRA